MEYGTNDYLKKTLLDTQERVRDFMHFSEEMKDKRLQQFFSEYAESEASHAAQLRTFIEQAYKKLCVCRAFYMPE